MTTHEISVSETGGPYGKHTPILVMSRRVSCPFVGIIALYTVVLDDAHVVLADCQVQFDRLEQCRVRI